MIWTLLKVIQFYLNNTINFRLLNPALKFGKCVAVYALRRDKRPMFHKWTKSVQPNLHLKYQTVFLFYVAYCRRAYSCRLHESFVLQILRSKIAQSNKKIVGIRLRPSLMLLQYSLFSLSICFFGSSLLTTVWNYDVIPRERENFIHQSKYTVPVS